MSDKPIRLGDALRTFLEESKVGERLEEATVVPEWAVRVGTRSAAVTAPRRVSRSTLLVAVCSSAWRMELRLMEREIVRRRNEGRQRGRIEKIRFVMSGDPHGKGE